MFKKIVNDALNFGMGVTATGKDKAEQLAKKIQDKCGVTKAESQKMVKEMIGEKIRLQFEKEFLSTQEELFDKLENSPNPTRRASRRRPLPKNPPPRNPLPKKPNPKPKRSPKPKANKLCLNVLAAY